MKLSNAFSSLMNKESGDNSETNKNDGKPNDDSIECKSDIITDFSGGKNYPSKYWPDMKSMLKKPKIVGTGVVTVNWKIISGEGMTGEIYEYTIERGEKIEVYKTHKGEFIIKACDGPGGSKSWMYLDEAPVLFDTQGL